MKTLLSAAALALSGLICAPAHAASVDMFGTLDAYVTDGVADLQVFDTDAYTTIDDHFIAGTASLTMFYETADILGTADAAFDLIGESGTLFSGVLESLSVSGDEIVSMVFAAMEGDFAAGFDRFLTLDLAFDDIFGANPLLMLEDGGSYGFAALGQSDISAVPLPAGGLLLMSGIAALMLRRRAKG